MGERVERAAQAPNATRWFSHEQLAQADQKLRLNNLRSNLRGKNGLGSTWMFQCQNKAVRRTKPIFRRRKKQGVHDKPCIGSWLSSYRWRSRGSLKGF